MALVAHPLGEWVGEEGGGIDTKYLPPSSRVFSDVQVHLPSSPTEFSPVTHLPAVISSLEGQVAKGAIGSYGFSCSSFSAAEDGSGNSSSSSSNSDGGDAVGQPVWKIMGVVESVLQDHHLSCLAYE